MGRKRLFNDKEKWCPKCNKWLPLSDFGANNRSLSGKQAYCKGCHSPLIDHSYETQVLKKRQMSSSAYSTLWEKQDRRCAICGEPLVLRTETSPGTKAVLDHDHVTEKVRGLLCTTCNTGLGAFKDNISALEKAIVYLKNPPAFEVSNGA